jgi:radical SAM protein with 4Fe4S-binding SPASM domain
MNKINFPNSVVLELTYRCNHRCVFCSCPWYATNSGYPKGEEMNLEQWKQTIDKLYDMGVQMFSISGGEAILKDCMPKIVEHIRKEGNKRGYNYPIVLISNGLAMREEYLQLFKRCNVHLGMSLPGYETFQEHTGVDNADGVLAWFTRAKEIGVTTTVNVTVTKKNIHELFETISMGLISGASSLLLNRFLPGGRGLTYKDELVLTPKQVNDMLDVAEEVLSLSGRYGNLGTEVAACAIKDSDKYKRLRFGYKCGAAKNFFVIDPSGWVRTCNHSPHIVGHISHDPIIDDVDYWKLFAEDQYKPNACKKCHLIDSCDCGCREVANILYGNPAEVDFSIVNKH